MRKRNFSTPLLVLSLILCCVLILPGALSVTTAAQGTGDAPETYDASATHNMPATYDAPETGNAQAADADVLASLIDDILAFEIAQNGGNELSDWIAGALREGAGKTTDFLAIAQRRYSDTADLSPYTEALSALLLQDADIPAGAVAKQRCALALLAIGEREHPFLCTVVDDTAGKQGLMSYIFALHLVTNGAPSAHTHAGDLIRGLLSRRLPGSGWALGGAFADVDVTAMALQALAPYRSVGEVRAATAEALAWLAKQQLPTGDFSGYGAPNAESTAQVMLALSALGVDVRTDTRFIKEGHTVLDGLLRYRLEDGSFCHTATADESDASATTQAFEALVALWRQEAGLDAFFVFDPSVVPSVETLPTSADIGDPAKPSGLSAPSDEPYGAPRAAAVSYKVWAVAGISLVTAVVCLWLIFSHRRRAKNFVFVLIVASLAVGVVLLTDIRSADRYYGEPIQKTDAIGEVTITIRCDTVLGKSGAAYIPSDGVILPVTTVPLSSGETVYDILTQVARAYRIQMESRGTASGVNSMAYVAGIGYLYEMAFGDYSGWVYYVNGVSASVGCGEYVLADGDRIEWFYTCDLGNDLK